MPNRWPDPPLPYALPPPPGEKVRELSTVSPGKPEGEWDGEGKNGPFPITVQTLWHRDLKEPEVKVPAKILCWEAAYRRTSSRDLPGGLITGEMLGTVTPPLPPPDSRSAWAHLPTARGRLSAKIS